MEIQMINTAFFKGVPKNKDSATIAFDDKRQKIRFNYVAVRYGVKRLLVCPICGKGRIRLYNTNGLFRCRQCCRLNPYNGIQNTTKGGENYIAYKMERYANRNGIGQFKYPFDYTEHPRPKGKHKAKWEQSLKVMQAFESMRFQSILYKKIWSTKTIQSVEKGQNPYVVRCSLEELKQYLYSFDTPIRHTYDTK